MSPEVAGAIHACLATAPGFEGLRDEVEALGFFETASHARGDVRWTHASGYDVFLYYAKSQTVCSVWFDGEYDAEASAISGLLTQDGYPAQAQTDETGTSWAIGEKKSMRLIVKEDEQKPSKLRKVAENLRMVQKKQVLRQRLGAALLVQRN